MRLGAFLLIAATVAAQDVPGLPWGKVPNLPWRAASLIPVPAQPVATNPSTGTLRVTLDPGGALKIVDGRGIVRLRTGLPGRPLKIWRDGGIPVTVRSGTWAFPDRTPLCQGIGALPLGQADFRPGLAGLLWILDDEERLVTLVHPATSRVTFLALPSGTGLDLVFLPDALAVLQTPSEASRPRSFWSLPWLSLLPQFIFLGTPMPPEKPGTALIPFPNG